MNTRVRMISGILIAFGILEGISLLFFLRSYQDKHKILEDLSTRELTNAYESAIAPYDDISSLFMQTYLENPEMLSAIARARALPQSRRASYRNSVWNSLRIPYNRVHMTGLKQMQIHFDDGTSFLRMHRPEKHGDNLWDYRYSIRFANRTRKELQGYEEGRIFNGFRFIYPLTWRNQHIGTFETALSFDALRENLERIRSGFYYFMLRTESREAIVFQEERANYPASLLSEKYVHEESDFVQALKGASKYFKRNDFGKINMKLRKVVQEKLKNDKAFSQPVSVDGASYNIVFLPVHNIEGEKAGWLVAYYNEPEFIQAIAAQSMYSIILISMVNILIVFLFSFIWQRNKDARKSNAHLTYLNSKLDELNQNLATQVETEKEKRNAQEQLLLYKSRTSAMGEMLGGIAHQWKQPLNSISLQIQVLEDYAETHSLTPEIIDETNKRILGQIQFLAETIDTFRDFFRTDKKISRVRIYDPIMEIVGLMKMQLKSSGVEVRVSETGDKLIVDINVNEFKHAILNLISNARDAILERQKSEHSFQGNIDIRIIQSKEHSIVIVEDNGGGIPSEVMERLFEPTFTTKGEKGTGIGLYITRMILEKNSARISASNSEEGAIFEIRFILPQDPP